MNKEKIQNFNNNYICYSQKKGFNESGRFFYNELLYNLQNTYQYCSTIAHKMKLFFN